MRDHMRGPVEDQVHDGGYTRGQITFLLFANATTILAVGSLIGTITAFIYVLGLLLGLVLGAARTHGATE